MFSSVILFIKTFIDKVMLSVSFYLFKPLLPWWRSQCYFIYLSLYCEGDVLSVILFI